MFLKSRHLISFFFLHSSSVFLASVHYNCVTAIFVRILRFSLCPDAADATRYHTSQGNMVHSTRTGETLKIKSFSYYTINSEWLKSATARTERKTQRYLQAKFVFVVTEYYIYQWQQNQVKKNIPLWITDSPNSTLSIVVNSDVSLALASYFCLCALFHLLYGKFYPLECITCLLFCNIPNEVKKIVYW